MSDGRPDRAAQFIPRTRPVVPPIHHSVTYFLDDQAYKDVQEGGLLEHWYSRFRNPTGDIVADEIATLEAGAAGFMTSSGMGAIATTLLTLVRSGDRIVAARQVYGDTRDLLVRDLPRWGVEVALVDATDLGHWREEIARGARVVYAETLSNPQLELTDLPALAELASAAGATLVVDNTFATPYVVQPLTLGADVVVHSATKFLNGHSDAIAGAVIADPETVTEVQRRVVTLGTNLGAYEAYLVWRGLQTFDVRMARQTATALQLARALAGRSDVLAVRHPVAAPDARRPDVADRVLRPGSGGGAMVTVTVAGGDDRAHDVVRALRIGCEATSLGGVETLVSTPYNSSHFSLSPQERRTARIDDGMIRVSCGLEPADALVADFERALDLTAGQA